jgi:hypothetical protein
MKDKPKQLELPQTVKLKKDGTIDKRVGSLKLLQFALGEENEMRTGYNRMKAQCKFRKEPFYITWEQFQDLWKGNWHNRGHALTCMCLSRKDDALPWNIENTQLIYREDWHRKRFGKERAPYKLNRYE